MHWSLLMRLLLRAVLPGRRAKLTSITLPPKNRLPAMVVCGLPAVRRVPLHELKESIPLVAGHLRR